MTSTKNLLGRKTLLWGIAALCWTLLIAYLCLIKSDNFNKFETFSIPHKDKYVHFTFYFVFTILWCKQLIQSNIHKVKTKWLVFGIGVSYGISIELLQNSIESIGRSADINDVLANTAGSLTGLLALRFFDKNET